MSGAAIVMLCLLAAHGAVAGQGEWRTYTPKKEVRSIVGASGKAWAATAGGLFSYESSSGSYRTWTTSEGLRSVDLTAVAADSTGTLWIGTAGGLLHRFDPVREAWSYISDIALQDAARKEINAIEAWGDSLMVLSEVGISVYSISRSEFGDSYLRFGVAPGLVQGGVTGAARYAGRLWASTHGGVVSTPLSNANPTEPSSWRVDGVAQGLPSAAASAILAAGDSLYVATAAGIAVWDGTAWRVLAGTGTSPVLGIGLPGGSCEAALFATASSIGAIGADGVARILDSPPGKVLSCLGPEGLTGTMNAGAFFFDACPAGGGTPGVAWSAIPPGPPSSKFVSIAVDGAGKIWSATGKSGGEGFMSFDGAVWRQFTAAEYPAMQINDFHHASVGPDNTAYIGSWGAGLAVVGPSGEIETVLNTTNGLQPSVLTDPFVVAGGTAVDRNGVAWLTERTPTGDTTLAMLRPDGSLDYITGCMYDASASCNTRTPVRLLNDVVIDDYGTKWFTNYGRFETESPRGLYFYNESGTITGTREGWGKLVESDGLPSDQIWSLAVDRYGDVWVGTDGGIAIIYSPTNPRAAIAPYRPLPDQIIQDILVDPLNRKWIATKRGVFLLTQDGTEVLEHFTVEGTGGQLLADDVASLAMDPRDGTIYFGTEKGLSSLTTAAVAPAKSYEALRVYPNPFEVPSHPQATVDGLTEGSSLKLFTVDGALVRALETPGGRLGFWDGRDSRGELVPSGVYVVIAYSADGTEVGTAKLAVIRK